MALCGAALAALSAGCEAEVQARTQLMLVADTDISEIQTIVFDVTGPSGDMPEPRSGLAHGDEPVTLALVHTKGPLGPIRVTARGLHPNGDEVLSRTHEVSFVPGKTLVVPMHLSLRCMLRDVGCDEGQVCSERGCLPVALSADDLEPYTPDLPRLGPGRDAGTSPRPDGGAPGRDGGPRDAAASDAAQLAMCPDAGLVDLQSDPAHCGDCDMACVQPAKGRRGESVCEQGTCKLVCPELTDDCDGMLENGCEQSLTVRAHCGRCGNACSPPNTCRMGECVHPSSG